MDFLWCTSGGVMVDGTGDISFSTPNQELIDMVYTRVKASTEGWQLYTLGANLDARIGCLITPTLCTKLQTQVSNSLSDILTAGSYQVQTLATGNTVDLFVIVNSTAILTVTVTQTSVQVISA